MSQEQILTKSQKRRRRRKISKSAIQKLVEQPLGIKVPKQFELNNDVKFLSQDDIDNLLDVAEKDENKNTTDFRKGIELLFGFQPGEVEDLNNEIGITEYFKDNNLDKTTFWLGQTGGDENNKQEERKVRLSNIDIEFMFFNIRNSLKHFMSRARFKTLISTKTPEELILFLADKNRTNQLSLYTYMYEGQRLTDMDFKILLNDIKIEESLINFLETKFNFSRKEILVLINKALYIKYAIDKKLEYINLDIEENTSKRIQNLSVAKNDNRKPNVD